MSKYTVFCQETGKGGTIWISEVEAETLNQAIEIGREQCAADWDWGDRPHDVHVLGVAEGVVHIVMWEDQEDD